MSRKAMNSWYEFIIQISLHHELIAYQEIGKNPDFLSFPPNTWLLNAANY
jgi:hypothetical protein